MLRAYFFGAVYHALVWIQGKTYAADSMRDPSVYHALVWIQGKTTAKATKDGKEYTMP